VTDDEFLRALEKCELPESAFGHAAHVRAAYLYLRAEEFSGALERMRRAIRNFARHLGKPERYHETITVAYLALIQQHMCQRGDGGGWAAFECDNPELLRPGLLLEYYPKAQLESDLARRVFVLPHSIFGRSAAIP
jgi:predicted metal-dependent hydrolase